MPEAPLHFAVLLGSMRRDRIGIRPARFVLAECARRGHRATLVDAMELQLPLLDRMYKEHAPGEAPPALESLARLYREVDGFLIVAGEYNHGIQPGLKNLLDHFLEEYFWRPSGIVCYSAGSFAGVRAAMQLRMTLAELGMASIPSLLPVPRAAQTLGEDGTPSDPVFGQRAGRFFDEFAWHAHALRAQRAQGTPY
jgi:NAD(P)H-dependent FMN reductase